MASLFKRRSTAVSSDLKRLSESETTLAQSSFNVEKITEIQNRFAGGEMLLVPGRIFIREGTMYKSCRKGLKKRQFFLFNDILVYGSIVAKGRYSNQHVLYLSHMTVDAECSYTVPLTDRGTQPGLESENAFQVNHSEKSFHVIAQSRADKSNWITNLDKQIKKIANASRRDQPVMKAVWIPDSVCKECPLCHQKFNAFIRKHHCRMCGRVVCSSCSPHKADISRLRGREVTGRLERVCSVCYKSTCGKVNKEIPDHDSTSSSSSSSSPSAHHNSSIDQQDSSREEDMSSSDTEDSDDSSIEATPIPPPRRKKLQQILQQQIANSQQQQIANSQQQQIANSQQQQIANSQQQQIANSQQQQIANSQQQQQIANSQQQQIANSQQISTSRGHSQLTTDIAISTEVAKIEVTAEAKDETVSENMATERVSEDSQDTGVSEDKEKSEDKKETAYDSEEAVAAAPMPRRRKQKHHLLASDETTPSETTPIETTPTGIKPISNTEIMPTGTTPISNIETTPTGTTPIGTTETTPTGITPISNTETMPTGTIPISNTMVTNTASPADVAPRSSRSPSAHIRLRKSKFTSTPNTS